MVLRCPIVDNPSEFFNKLCNLYAVNYYYYYNHHIMRSWTIMREFVTNNSFSLLDSLEIYNSRNIFHDIRRIKREKKMTNQNFLWNNNFSSLVTLLLRLFSSGLKRWPRVTVQLKKQQSTKIRKINRNKNKKNNSARTISSKRIYIYTKWERS